MTEKVEKIAKIISSFMIGSLIIMTLSVCSYGEVAFGQNGTSNGTGTGATKFGSFVIPGSDQNATGNEIGVETAQPGLEGGSSAPLSDLTIAHAGGEFTSLQVDASNKTWITTGSWDLVSNPSSSAQSGSPVNFNATIISRGTDNTGEHEHKISEFKLTNRSINSGSEGSTMVFNGTASVETDVGLYSDVPISIRIADKAPAIISIDTQSNEIEPQWVPGGGTIGVSIDERVEDHFGNTPIYGNVKRE